MILPLFSATQIWPNMPEIERTVAASHPLLRESRVATFTVEVNRGRGLVVMAEIPRRLHRIWELDLCGDENPLLGEIQDAIRLSVSKRHRIAVNSVVLVPRNSLPRDELGSIDHSACRQRYLAKAFTPLDRICA